MRSDVLSYCASVATSPDPDDPDSILREVEDAKVRERVVDERLDPYSARYFPKELRTEMLANVIRNERMVENIIRTRTWGMVAERCGDEGRDFEAALNEWRKKQESKP
ncbi:Caffeine-induced death protein 2 [Macrophomina phaseolina MS6]|uniref:Caffeine-induced death protein 2 n=2 Tax=Macrophomina phaseolina TaxID=35725 RepID=K2S3A3_MACPH|nr:Caffeine-induced death protein 2 [Macrophomina phaseolina MS6]